MKPTCPTPEALTCVQLQRVEKDLQDVHSPRMTVKGNSHTGHSLHRKDQEEQIACSDKCQEEGVRSDNQLLVLASSPLREGPSSSDRCPCQALSKKRMGLVRTDQTEASMLECMTHSNGQVLPQDEPQQRATEMAQPTTLCSPKLLKDDTEVIGANKHHLKRQDKRRRIEKQLYQERGSHWTTHNGASSAD